MQAEPIIGLHTHAGLRLFGFRVPGDHISANDVGRFSTVLAIDGVALNSAPVAGDLMGGVVATESPLIRVVFDNRDRFWSRLLAREVVLYQLMSLYLYYGGDQLFTWFLGDILSIDPRKDTCTVEFGEGGPLHERLKLPTAARYAKPGNPADVLPVVYGDFLSDHVNGTGEDAGGMTPAVLIDRDNRIYLVSNSRCASDRPKVYVDQALQEDSAAIYTWFPDVDLGDGRRIAALQFHVPVSGEVSVRIRGTINPFTGALLTDPLDAIQHLFVGYGTWTLDNFDNGSLHRTRAENESKGYTIHWCFNEEHSYKEWLVEVLRHYWIGHVVTAHRQLAFTMTPDHVYPERVWGFIDARQDLAGDDPEASVTCPIAAADLCNAGTVEYRWSWSSQQYTGTFDFEALPSVRMHDGRKERDPFQLPGIRTEAHASAWAAQLLRYTAYQPMRITLPLRDLRYPFLLPGSFFSFSWAQAPTGDGNGWPATAPRILGVRNIGLDVGNPYTGAPQAMVLDCFDTGIQYRRTTYLQIVDNNANTWFLYVNDAGELSADPNTAGLDIMNPGAPLRYLQRQSPNATTYYVHFMTNAAGTGIEGEPSTVSPGGVGSSTDFAFVNRLYQTYRVRVSDRPEVYTARDL